MASITSYTKAEIDEQLGAKANTADLGTAATASVGDFATAAQGAKADTAVQPGSLSTVATTGAYADLAGKPTLGTAAATASTAYATAAQGAKADGAAQKLALHGGLRNALVNGAFVQGVTRWENHYSTLAATGGVATVTSSGTTNYPGIKQTMVSASIPGHVWYLRASVKVTNNGGAGTPIAINYQINSGANVSFVSQVAAPALGTEYTVGRTVSTPATVGLAPLQAMVRVQWPSNVTAATFEVRNVLAVNLTETFGTGNEPTAAQMDAIVAAYPTLVTIPVQPVLPSATDIATSALVSRMAARPTLARTAAIHSLIRSLMASGVWPKLDALWVLAAHSQQAAQLNWVGGAQDLTATNAPVFAVDRGFTGDGATAYLDTNTPGTSLERYAAADSALGVYVRTAGAGVDVSVSANAYLNSNSGGNVLFKGNGGTEGSVSAAGETTGLFSWSRDATTVTVYRAGASLGTATLAPADLVVTNALLLRDPGTSYSTRQIAAAFIASGLTANEQALLNGALVGYLTAVGGQ